MKRLRGFTLIEVMITVAILAIVASLAYPSFIGAIRKSRRSEAFDGITRIQQAQERWRANHSSYTTDTSNATGLGVSTTTPNGYYTLAVTVPTDEKSASEYTITATATGSQAADTKCAFLSMKADGGQLTYNSTSAQTCWSK
jgi:type IV pilus assembly protein PilE